MDKSGKAGQSFKNVSNVGELEHALLSLYPALDAEPWDRTGLLVGDRQAPILGVSVALDPTVEAIRRTAENGSNVLVTHHPLFLDPPTSFTPQVLHADPVGARVWEAIDRCVAVMSFHTALDMSPRAACVLPGKLGLECIGILDQLHDNPARGYGQICFDPNGASLTLGALAERCSHAFGRSPRVWGAAATPLDRVVTCTGAAGDCVRLATHLGIDCLVCGEVRYHDAVDALQAGLTLIDLGHDVSEWPLCELLVSSIMEAGVDAQRITLLDMEANWR